MGVLSALHDRGERSVDVAEDGGALGRLGQRAQDLGELGRHGG
jgi:hypothetical protein